MIVLDKIKIKILMKEMKIRSTLSKKVWKEGTQKINERYSD